MNSLPTRCCYDCDIFKWDVINLGEYQICFECLDIRRTADQTVFADQLALHQQQVQPAV